MAESDSQVPQNSVECNFQCAGTSQQLLQDEEEFFFFTALGRVEQQTIYETVPHCASWKRCSGLYLRKEDLIRRPYAHNKELGLFHLMLNLSYLNCVWSWTIAELIKRGKKRTPLRMEELLAYFGLELDTSVHRLNHLRDYWCPSDLLNIPFFQKVMGRDMFLNIRSALRMYATYNSNVAVTDPLWHSRQILEHFARNAATLAVPVGVSTLDENAIRCKGRTAARSYMKSKPVRFGIRFYAVVGSSHAYLHSFQDNGSGNKSGQTPVQRYTNVFRNLRCAIDRKLGEQLVGKTKPSALWCAQMAHQTQLHPTPTTGRLMVMDNCYTRHTLARQLAALTDGECKILGTVRHNNVDGINRPALKEAMESLRHEQRGEWRPVQVYDKSRELSLPPTIEEHAGFVVFKDLAVVSFYTNDLAGTPSLRIHEPDAHAVMCVHRLAPLKRWTGSESLTRTTLYVPAIIVAYNLFMNGVDRFDQFRSTTATLRKERRVTMSILTFILKASILNAHALLHSMSEAGEKIMDISAMKRRIIMQLVREHLEYKQQHVSMFSVLNDHHNPSPAEMCIGVHAKPHLLLETEGGKSVRCMLCHLLSGSQRGGYTKFSCTECKSGFHVNCFSFYHNRDVF